MSSFTIDWYELSMQVTMTFVHFLWQACVVAIVLHVGDSLRDSQIHRRHRGPGKLLPHGSDRNIGSDSGVSVRLGETALRGANLRYSLACLAFFALPICVVVTFVLVHQSRGSIFLAANAPTKLPTFPAVIESQSNPPLASNSVGDTATPLISVPPQWPSEEQIPVVEPFDKPELVVLGTTWTERTRSLAPYLLIAYAIGVCLMLARFGLSIIGSSRLRQKLQPITDSNLLRIIAEQASRLGLKRVPIVALCQRVSVPVVVGIVKPMILLPPSLLCGLDPNQLAAILSHEMAHIQRYDLIVNLLQRIVEALLFFHPVTWWISRRVSIERENCCDDVAAACTGRLSYAGALLQMAELCIGSNTRRRTALTALSADGGNSTDFGYRIRRLIGAEETNRIGLNRRSIAVGLATVLLGTVSLVAWGQNQISAEKASSSNQAPPNTGVLTGRIAIDGVHPKLPKLRVPTPDSPRLSKRATDEAREEYEASLVEVEDESLLVDAELGLANAFVFLVKAPANWQPTQADLKPLTLTMQDFRFEPRAAIVRTGQDLRLTNTSAGSDNLGFEPLKNGPQNRLVEGGSETTLEKPFISPEQIPIQFKSQMNAWKTAFLLPLDHPFAAITDKQGRFSIEGLPTGEHSFAVWHESAGWLEKSFVVKIEAGQTTSTDRAFSVDRFQLAQQALIQKGHELSGKRADLVRRIDRAANQRDKAKRYSSDYYRLDHTLKMQELLLAKFDLENATANIVVPNAPQATPERIAELRELLRIRWGLAVDGIQVGLGMIGDRSEFEPSEKISFQVYIRNATEEPITQKLRWFDVANSTSLLRCLLGSSNNIFLSIRPGSSLGQVTELLLEPGEIRELPRSRFEMDTAGLHPGVYSVEVHFPVVFPNQAGESATRIARPIDSGGTPFEILFHFELKGDQPPLDVIPPDTASEIIETSEVKWGTPVFGLQAGARFRHDATISGEIDTAGTALPRSSIKHHTLIGDTVKTELLFRNISNQPIKVRFQPAIGKELQSLSAMESGLTELSSRAIMRRSPVEAVEKSTRTIERTLQPGEQFIVAHQDFEIQQLVNGRERQLSLPEANRHWVPGQGDYIYRAYLKLGITDSLSVSLHSGGIEIRIDPDKDPQVANQAVTTETKASPLGEPNMNDDLKEISELIASGKTIPRELNDKYDAVHLNLTAAERLKSVKLLAVPDFVMQVLLSEPTYSCAEKVGLLSELKDLNFGKMEFGLQECMANVATEYAQADPAATREWLAQFQGAEYGVGMGLTAVLKAAKQKDPATSLEILRSLSDAEGECIVTCGDIPKYDLPASDWLKEVQRFKSHALRSCFLGGPMVFHFGEESPEAALDYILSIPKETRTPQLGYQLVSCVLRSKRFTWTEILDWMETKLPIETRSPEHYGLLADTWSQQDNASFQLWFQELKDPVIRDEAIRGIQAIGQPQDWAAMLALAQQITDQTKRQAKVAWVLNAWKLTDPSAALAQLDNADVSKERRTQLQRDITARLAQVATVGQPAFIPQVNANRKHADQESEQPMLGQWDISPTPAKTGIVPQAESMTLMFSEQGKFERYVQKQDFIEFATGSWKLHGNKVSVKFRPFAMQPSDNAEIEATLQLDAPDSLILDGTRFLKRSPAIPVTLDAKHPLHGIANDLLSKLNARAPQPEDANHFMRMLNTSDPHETWQLVQFSDKPAMSATQVVNRFDASRATGFRLLLARDYRESANMMQQAVLLPNEQRFRLRTEQIELVLFAAQPLKAPVELKSNIAWLPAQSRLTTHDMCLGDGQGYTWFVRAPLHVSDRLYRDSQLVGGDDMLATLVQSAISRKNMPPGSDANVASAMLGNYGDRAVAAVEQAVREKKAEDELWHIIGSLAGIRTDTSTKLLIQLYQSDDADIRRAAAYALIHKPYRREASLVYLDMLKNRMSVEASTAASIELDLKEAIPILAELFANTKKPSSLRELHTIFAARRTLEGNPIPQSLLDASEVIYQSRATDLADEGSVVGNAMEQFTDSVDHEAVIMLALQMVNYRTKGSSDHVRAFGTTILKSQKRAEALLFMAKVLESLPPRERDEILQSMKPFAPEK